MESICYDIEQKYLNYPLSKGQFFYFNTYGIDQLRCEFCAHFDIYFNDNVNKIYVLFGFEQAFNICTRLTDKNWIKALLKGELVCQESPGIAWNDFFQGKIKNTDVDKFLLFSNSSMQIRPFYNSWMYNDQEGNIIFEITERYSWKKSESKRLDFVSYHDFIKDFKPIVKIIVDPKYFKQWKKHATGVAQAIGISL